MIIVLVTFPTVELEPSESEALLRQTAPAYRDISDLRRKYFIGNESIAGGVYEWTNRSAASAYYNEDWQQKMSDRYGVRPEIQFFNAPCLVDNVSGEVIYDV